jgi:hypothetical protein
MFIYLLFIFTNEHFFLFSSQFQTFFHGRFIQFKLIEFVFMCNIRQNHLLENPRSPLYIKKIIICYNPPKEIDHSSY